MVFASTQFQLRNATHQDRPALERLIARSARELGALAYRCGGWSRRRTLFGGDAHRERDAQELDPAIDAAKIRAFFVDPDHARQGIGKALLERCEAEARRRGFTRFELMGTLPGMRLYRALGYVGDERVHYPVASGVTIEFVPMRKALR